MERQTQVAYTMKRAEGGRMGLFLALVALLFLAALPACGGGGGGTGGSDGDVVDDTGDDPGNEPPPDDDPIDERVVLAFVEVAEAVGLDATFAPPEGQWKAANFRGGGTVGDFNGDGWQDLFVLGGGAHPDRLFLNDGDGTFTDHGAAWGVDAYHYGSGAAAGDYDGDGDLDLFVTSLGDPTTGLATGAHRLYRNTGAGSFEDVAALAGVQTSSPTIPDGMGAAFGDYDLDGDLDLVVCGWSDATAGTRLFENQGDGTFEDVTATMLPPKAMHAFGARFVDMDGDRYPELLFAADFYTGTYLVGHGTAPFEDRTASSGTGLDTNGMGAEVADIDGDGHMDWFVTSIYLAEPPTGGPPTGNMLYLGDGNHAFLEGSAAAGVQDNGWAWGTVAADFDHDGDVDLGVTNGWKSGGPDGPHQNVMNRMYRNDGEGVFEDVAAECGFDHTGLGRGLVRLDIDNDGDQDIALFANGERMCLYRNETVTDDHWLRILLDTSADAGLAPDGYGTHVRIRAGTRTWHRTLEGGCTYLGHNELAIHVGLGEADQADEVRVTWADGRVTTLEDVAANQTLTIASPGP